MRYTDYRLFYDQLKSFIPESRMATDPLRTLAYGTDASFYRLVPKIVVRADSEAEVARVLKQAGRQHIPVTFRAAGTSLSGQAVSDSVLLVAGGSWGWTSAHNESRMQTVQGSRMQGKPSGNANVILLMRFTASSRWWPDAHLPFESSIP